MELHSEDYQEFDLRITEASDWQILRLIYCGICWIRMVHPCCLAHERAPVSSFHV
jgi:hypothetical protein